MRNFSKRTNGRQQAGLAITTPRTIFKRKAPFRKRGLLLSVEGLDGCGKTSVVSGLRDYLGSRDVPTIVSNWNDTTEVYNLMMDLNTCGYLNPAMRCIFGAAELAARYHYVILPALEAGTVVFATKYLLSAMAHSLIRGHDEQFVSRLYSFALDPDLTFYVDVPPELALARKLASGSPGFWEAGLDLAVPAPVEEALDQYENGKLDEEFVALSFLKFQTKLRKLHLQLLGRGPAVRLDGAGSPELILNVAIQEMERLLAGRIEPATATSLGSETGEKIGDGYGCL